VSLVLLAHEVHPRYRLVVAANRDEYHRRETEPAAWWRDAPAVLAGRDLEEGGTWLGITRAGRFAAVTAYRDPKRLRRGLRSRGLIVSDFLEGESGSLETLRALSERPRDHNPFSVLMHDGDALGWGSNRVRGARNLEPGIYGLSNHLLDTPWHKVASGKRELESVLGTDPVRAGDLLALLDSRIPAADRMLPHTGVGADCERWLSPRFVVGQSFGTRAASVLLVSREGTVEFVERRFDVSGVESATARFTFSVECDRSPAAMPVPGQGLQSAQAPTLRLG
jgi:uncharacterized protein with NRDE domain